MMHESARTIAAKLPLEGLRVGISGAVPEREFWGSVPDLDRLILIFVAQLSALVVRFGGEVVHGSQPLLTPVVAEQARRQSREGATSLRLFASQLFGELPEVTRRAARLADADVTLTRPVGKGDYRDRETRNRSLTAMRLAMTQDVDVLVAVGGKLHTATGFNPGVLEELAQARWHGVPCFIVGAFGGVAGKLDLPILEQLSGGNLLDKSAVPPVEMATWSNSMDEYVGRLLAHFGRYKEQFISRRRAEPGSSRLASSIRRERLFAETEVGPAAKIVNVDPAAVGEWSGRFSELLHAVETKDSRGAQRLLISKEEHGEYR